MKSDTRLAKYLLLILLLPLGMAMCSGDRFRYPCQDPTNWDKDMCKVPICDVTRTCPEQIFKGQRDPKGLVTTTPVAPTPTTPAGACK
jgi:hypothetical protein